MFVNAGDELLMQLSEGHNRETYGVNGSLIKGEIKQTIPYLVYSLKTRKGDLYVKTHLIGGYNFDNAMAASALGIHWGLDPQEIQKAIEAYQPSNLRSQLIKTAHNTVILDAYNANPSSMQVSVSNFGEMKAGIQSGYLRGNEGIRHGKRKSAPRLAGTGSPIPLRPDISRRK